MSEILYRVPTPQDGAALSAMAAKSFADTFADSTDPDELRVHLAQSYGPNGVMQADLSDPAIDWQAGFAGEEPIGYIKLSAMTLPYAALADALEVRQLYVALDWKGHDVAQRLMEWAIDLARARNAPELYLAVFDHNHRAKRFYARFGFAEVGRYDFYTGAQAHDERIWRLAL